MTNERAQKTQPLSGIGTIKILLFFFISTAFSICVALIVSHGFLEKDFLNAMPLSPGFIGVLLLGRALASHRQKTTRVIILAIIPAALVLETLRAYLPVLKIAFNGILIGFIILVLFRYRKAPLPQIGAHVPSGMKRALVLALLFGLMPFGLSYVILAIAFPGSVVRNPDWAYAENPALGMVLLFVSFCILYLNGLIGEEAGWRGFLVRGMAVRYNRGKVIWFSSLLFALWHLPFDSMIGRMDAINIVVNQGVRVLTGASFAYFFVATGWSLIPVSLFHTMFNFIGYNIVNPTGPFLAKLNDVQGLIFAILFLILIVAVLFVVRWRAVQRGEWSPTGVPSSRREGIMPDETWLQE